MIIDDYCQDLLDSRDELALNEILVFETEAGKVVLSRVNANGGTCGCCMHDVTEQKYTSVYRTRV